MKILHIIPNLRKGGAERIVINICAELKRQGVEVCLVTFSAKNEYAELTKEIQYKVIPSKYVPSITGKPVTQTQELQKFIEEFEPTIIHTHLWQAEIVSRQIYYPKAKWFSHFHDNMPQLKKVFLPRSKTEITNLFERKLMLKKYAECQNSFIAISDNAYNYAKAVLPKKHKIHKLDNAIDVDFFRNPSKSSLPLENSTILKLLTVGSLVNKKNQIFLLQVVAELQKIGICTELNILGDGVNKEMLQKAIIDQGLEKNVFLRGNVEVRDYYWSADIYVHSAIYEPFGLVLLEAMAAGLPVVALDGGGNRDIIEQGKNGFIFSEQNAELFAETIKTLWEDSNQYNAISFYAQEFVKKYDIKGYVERLLDVYSID